MRACEHLLVRALLLAAMAVAIDSMPVQAGFCDEVCYPTCDDYAGHCAADGGWVDELCSCQTAGYGWSCSPGTCEYPLADGG